MKNNDLISRSALIANYDRIHVGEPGKARKLMEDAPAVDAVPVVHGRWVFVELPDLSWYGHKPGWYCSNCGCKVEDNRRKPRPPHMRHCPNCGAKMDGDNNA